MKSYKCRRCGKRYTRNDPADMFNDDPDIVAKCGRTENYEPEGWEPKDGRCYECFIDFLAEVFGDWCEPCFQLGEDHWMASGKVPEWWMKHRNDPVPDDFESFSPF